MDGVKVVLFRNYNQVISSYSRQGFFIPTQWPTHLWAFIKRVYILWLDSNSNNTRRKYRHIFAAFSLSDFPWKIFWRINAYGKREWKAFKSALQNATHPFVADTHTHRHTYMPH